MAKLGALKPRLSGLPSRIGAADRDGKGRAQHRAATQHWRAWYKTARWTKLRASILKRDLYTCQRTGILLIGKYPAPNSAVVDHIRPHRGNEALFWDEANLQAISKAEHDKAKQAEEAKDIKGVWY